MQSGGIVYPSANFPVPAFRRLFGAPKQHASIREKRAEAAPLLTKRLLYALNDCLLLLFSVLPPTRRPMAATRKRP